MKREFEINYTSDATVCPECEESAAQCENEEENFFYGFDEDAVELQATVPVWTCRLCGFAWTDGQAEAARNEAVCIYLSKKEVLEYTE